MTSSNLFERNQNSDSFDNIPAHHTEETSCDSEHVDNTKELDFNFLDDLFSSPNGDAMSLSVSSTSDEVPMNRRKKRRCQNENSEVRIDNNSLLLEENDKSLPLSIRNRKRRDRLLAEKLSPHSNGVSKDREFTPTICDVCGSTALSDEIGTGLACRDCGSIISSGLSFYSEDIGYLLTNGHQHISLNSASALKRQNRLTDAVSKIYRQIKVGQEPSVVRFALRYFERFAKFAYNTSFIKPLVAAFCYLTARQEDEIVTLRDAGHPLGIDDKTLGRWVARICIELQIKNIPPVSCARLTETALVKISNYIISFGDVLKRFPAETTKFFELSWNNTVDEECFSTSTERNDNGSTAEINQISDIFQELFGGPADNMNFSVKSYDSPTEDIDDIFSSIPNKVNNDDMSTILSTQSRKYEDDGSNTDENRSERNNMNIPMYIRPLVKRIILSGSSSQSVINRELMVCAYRSVVLDPIAKKFGTRGSLSFPKLIERRDENSFQSPNTMSKESQFSVDESNRLEVKLQLIGKSKACVLTGNMDAVCECASVLFDLIDLCGWKFLDGDHCLIEETRVHGHYLGATIAAVINIAFLYLRIPINIAIIGASLKTTKQIIIQRTVRILESVLNTIGKCRYDVGFNFPSKLPSSRTNRKFLMKFLFDHYHDIRRILLRSRSRTRN